MTIRFHLAESAALFGVATTFSLLVAGPASASGLLSFTFSFEQASIGISGFIAGLADNTIDQSGPPVSVSVTSGPADYLGTYDVLQGFQGGFAVSNGSIVFGPGLYSNAWIGCKSDTCGTPAQLNLSFSNYAAVPGASIDPASADDGPAPRPVTYTGLSTTASVPGPLPVLGAAAAFGFTRQLRKRIKSSAVD